MSQMDVIFKQYGCNYFKIVADTNKLIIMFMLWPRTDKWLIKFT